MGVTYKKLDTFGLIEFDLPDSRVNLLTREVLTKLDGILDDIKAQNDVEVVILSSAKPNVFIAGADIKEIQGITEAADAIAKAEFGQNVFNKLEDLSMPSIAVIDGVALGGGCEIVLACDYRVATFNEKVAIGLPEVKLGILPGFGGTYRLPRIVGLSEALKIILPGKAVDANKALRIGLVDALLPQAGLERSVHEFAAGIKGKKRSKRCPVKGKKGMGAFLDGTLPGRWLVFSQSKKSVLKSSKGFYPAPLKALAVIARNLCLDRSRGLRVEAEGFSELAATAVSKNLIHLFYLSEKYKKIFPSQCASLTPRTINKCAVLGAGVMGGGIAQLLSYKDITPRLKDINHQALAAGLKSAYKVFQDAVKRRRLTRAQAAVKMARITTTLDYSGFQNVDCVIEAVVEDMKIKKAVLGELADVIPAETVICTNTSALSVTEMAAAVRDPSRVIGFHFFNPVHRMPLVEIITGKETSAQTLATALALARRLGKTPVIVKDSPGFLVNRILLAYLNEAGRLLEEGQSIERLDAAMTDFGMPMGPFTLSDEVGLDVGVKVLHILAEGLGERFKPVEIFEKVYQAGLLGKKSGEGFYLHGKKRTINPRVAELGTRGGASALPAKDCRSRMVMIMINEAAECLADGIIESAADVDIGMIMGTGFPPFRGGLLRYADAMGIDNVVETLKLLEGRLNAERFRPAKFLLDLKEAGRSFYD